MFIAISISLIENGTCNTPSNASGICKLLRTCPVLIPYASKPVTPEKHQFLQGHVCGTSGDNRPLVCCPYPHIEENNESETRLGATTRR